MRTRIKRVANGKWVAEVKKWYGWCGIWGENSDYTAVTWSGFYSFAWNNTEVEARKALNNYFAQRGI